MSLEQARIFGQPLTPTGDPNPHGELYLYETRKAGHMLTRKTERFTTDEEGNLLDSDGQPGIKVPVGSSILVYANAPGFNTCEDGQPCSADPSNAVWFDIPDDIDKANFEDLATVPAVPSTGLTVQDNGVALPGLYGTFNIIGASVSYAAGVVTLDFSGGVVGSAAWGSITGTLSNQTDLQNALNAKQAAFTAQSANRVYAGPTTGSAAAPSFRALVAADIPDLGGSYALAGHTHAYSDLTGIPSSFAPSAHAASHAAAGSDPVTLAQSQITGLVSALAGKQATLGYTAENTANKDQVNGYAGLDSSGKLNPSQLPAIAISSFLGSVASQAAMLALTGQEGDWAIRTDSSTTWIIIGADPTQLSNWKQMATPTDTVTSVFGRTGAVTAQNNDYTAAQVGLGNVANALQLVAANNLSDLTSAATARGNLGLVIGTNVQAYSARLGEVASIGSALQQIRVNAGGTGLEYFTATGGGATTALDNLASVAINDHLLFGTDNSKDIGDSASAHRPRKIFVGTGIELNVNGSPYIGNIDFGGAKLIFGNAGMAKFDGQAGTGSLFGSNWSPQSTSAYQKIFDLSPTIAQGGSGGYAVFYANVTENSTGSGNKNLIDLNVGSAQKFAVDHAGIMSMVNYLEMTKITDPASSAANKGRMYLRDNGSGKMQFVAVFPSGAVQVIATEP